MPNPDTRSLKEQMREHKFQSRLELANLVASFSSEEERIEAAKSIIQQIAMHRVFDRFSKEQEGELLDVVWPLAHPEEAAKRPLLFGHGAKTNLSQEKIPLRTDEKKMTTPITIELPEEFLDLCKRDHTTPETVLRGFIGDLCGTTSINFDRPRDDGYSSNGSDEREFAWQYYDRAGYNRAQFGE